jgi:hypothetical protein
MKQNWFPMKLLPKARNDYLVEFSHNQIQGEIVHQICFFEPKVGWSNNIPQCCRCNNIPRSFDMGYALGWRKIPTIVDDLMRGVKGK